MKDIPGSETIRSTTGRGSAQIDLFFSWKVNMMQTELYVLSRLAQIALLLTIAADLSDLPGSDRSLIEAALEAARNALPAAG